MWLGVAVGLLYVAIHANNEAIEQTAPATEQAAPATSDAEPIDSAQSGQSNTEAPAATDTLAQECAAYERQMSPLRQEFIAAQTESDLADPAALALAADTIETLWWDMQALIAPEPVVNVHALNLEGFGLTFKGMRMKSDAVATGDQELEDLASGVFGLAGDKVMQPPRSSWSSTPCGPTNQAMIDAWEEATAG